MTDEDSKPRGSIILKPGSTNLYVSFRYRGKRIEKSTGLVDTPENRKQARALLDKFFRKIDDKTFRFAKAFPGAGEKEKSFFAELENWEYSPEPNTLSIGDYIDTWMETILSTYPSTGVKKEYRASLKDWILPFFRQKSFRQLTQVAVRQFLAQLLHRTGPKKGQKLSRSRIGNILTPLRAIWNDACDEYNWALRDPFRDLVQYLPPKPHERRKVFRFEEWVLLLHHMDPYYRPIAEIMLMTGMIASEVAALRRSDLQDDHIVVRHAIVLQEEKDLLKTPYRHRRIPITKAIAARLQILLERTDGESLFIMKNGRTFGEGAFRTKVWIRVFKQAGLPYEVPYAMRHTFAAWALTIGMDPNRLVKLMGHSTKKMIYEVYGEYREGLEKDRQKILEYFGEDFLSR